jgi:flagellar basal body-associated protein FliL
LVKEGTPPALPGAISPSSGGGKKGGESSDASMKNGTSETSKGRSSSIVAAHVVVPLVLLMLIVAVVYFIVVPWVRRGKAANNTIDVTTANIIPTTRRCSLDENTYVVYDAASAVK